MGVRTCMWDPGSRLNTATYGMVAPLPSTEAAAADLC
jgi:hypothetical protein